MRRFLSRIAVVSMVILFSVIPCMVVGVVFGGAGALAAEPLLPPPYQIANTNHIVVGVTWDEAVVRKLLPPGIKPVDGMTGGINIYQAPNGYGITPYQSAYFWVDIEGFDSPQGTKGRWMLQGVYGPEAKTANALREFYGFPVRNGTSRLEETAESKRAMGILDGQPFVTVEIKPMPDPCQNISGLLNYPGVVEKTKQIMINQIPYTLDLCKAEVISVKVTAPPGDPFAALHPAKVLGAVELKNGAFSFSRPVPAP
jgi:hypothetical protein